MQRVFQRLLAGASLHVTTWALTFALRLGIVFVGTLNVIVVARTLGPAGSGQYFVFVAFVMVVAAIVELGFSQSATVFLARDPDAIRAIHSVLLRRTAVTSALLVVAGIVITLAWRNVQVLPSIPSEWLWLAAFAIPFTLYANVWNGMAIGLSRNVTAGFVQLAIAVLSCVLNIILLAVLRGRALSAVAAFLMSSVAQTATMMALVPRFVRGGRAAHHRANLGREMLSFGLRSYAGTLSSFVWMRVPVFLLDTFHGPTAVGLFSTAQQLADRVLLPAQVAKEVIYHDIASVGRNDATAMTNRYLRVAISALIPLICIVAVSAPFLLRIVLGSEYVPAAGIFRILFVGSMIMIVPTLLVPYFLGQLRAPGLLSVLAWINVVINTSIALLLIPRYGETGAAISLVLTQLLGTALALGVYLRRAGTTFAGAILVQPRDVVALTRRFCDAIKGALL